MRKRDQGGSARRMFHDNTVCMWAPHPRQGKALAAPRSPSNSPGRKQTALTAHSFLLLLSTLSYSFQRLFTVLLNCPHQTSSKGSVFTGWLLLIVSLKHHLLAGDLNNSVHADISHLVQIYFVQWFSPLSLDETSLSFSLRSPWPWWAIRCSTTESDGKLH